MDPVARELVLFDHDGVVVDSGDVFCQALIEGCARAGLTAVATPEDVIGLFDDNVYDSLRALGADERQIRVAVGWSAAALRTAAAWLRPFPLMREVLGDLGEARHVVIVSSNADDVVTTFLRRQRITGVAEVLGADEGQSKVEKIAALLERFPGQETYWFVGDTAGDMREARLAGVTPVGVAWGWHEPERLLAAGAERVAASPADLLAIIAPDVSTDFLGVG